MKLDKFELKLNVMNDENGHTLISHSVYVNQQNIAPKNGIDLLNLAKSCQEEGEFYIINCECGVPECGAIEHGVRVSHTDDHIIWEVPNQAKPVNNNESTVSYVRYVFSRAQLIACAHKTLIETKKIAFNEKLNVSFVMLNFRLEHLSDLCFPRFRNKSKG